MTLPISKQKNRDCKQRTADIWFAAMRADHARGDEKEFYKGSIDVFLRMKSKATSILGSMKKNKLIAE